MPNVNRPVFKVFQTAAKDVTAGNCPWCKKPIHPNKDFRNALSLKEYEISGICQACQDDYYKTDKNEDKQ